jgi:hypothetical protein
MPASIIQFTRNGSAISSRDTAAGGSAPPLSPARFLPSADRADSRGGKDLRPSLAFYSPWRTHRTVLP